MDGRLIANRYLLNEGEANGGSSNRILSATDTLLDRKVAVKVRGWGDDETSAGSRASLVREAKYLARLQHSNIITLYDFFQMGNSMGMVMPYFQGNMITNYRRSANTDYRSSVRLFENVAHALDYCAAQGI